MEKRITKRIRINKYIDSAQKGTFRLAKGSGLTTDQITRKLEEDGVNVTREGRIKTIKLMLRKKELRWIAGQNPYYKKYN